MQKRLFDLTGDNLLFAFAVLADDLKAENLDNFLNWVTYGDGALDGGYLRLTFVFDDGKTLLWHSADDDITLDAGERLAIIFAAGATGKTTPNTFSARVFDALQRARICTVIVNLD